MDREREIERERGEREEEGAVRKIGIYPGKRQRRGYEGKRARGTKCSSRFCDGLCRDRARAIDASTRFELLSLEFELGF